MLDWVCEFVLLLSVLFVLFFVAVVSRAFGCLCSCSCSCSLLLPSLLLFPLLLLLSRFFFGGACQPNRIGLIAESETLVSLGQLHPFQGGRLESERSARN